MIECHHKATGDEERSYYVARAQLRMKPVLRKTDLRDIKTLYHNGIA